MCGVSFRRRVAQLSCLLVSGRGDDDSEKEITSSTPPKRKFGQHDTRDQPSILSWARHVAKAARAGQAIESSRHRYPVEKTGQTKKEDNKYKQRQDAANRW